MPKKWLRLGGKEVKGLKDNKQAYFATTGIGETRFDSRRQLKLEEATYLATIGCTC